MSKGPAESQKKEGHEAHAHKAEGHSEKKGKGGPSGVAGGCTAWGCKKDSAQFSFCAEHFDHFKFGLIKKTGEQVPDYEKKFEHYQAFLAKKRAHKVA